MVEEKILCSQCNRELVMKFIELKDLVFCSNQCLDKYITAMGQKKFFREYGDVFVPGEGKGWVPKYANDYIMMCTRCSKSYRMSATKILKSVQPIMIFLVIRKNIAGVAMPDSA